MNGKTILVVEDNAASRELLTELLRTQGLDVVAAGDGHAALEGFAQWQPDLVLLDVQMPGVDGFEVCRRLKREARTRLTPVVLVTALSATEDYVRGLEAGADDFLTKPVNKQELLARVRSLLRLKLFTDELENAEAVLCSLALSIEAKDPCTEGHCDRLAKYSVELAAHLGLLEEQRVALRRAGIVHDIGKVTVPEHILLKPARLTPAERKIMEQHPLVGERICRPLKSFQLVLPIIRHHHEKLDGSGYPDGLKGEEVPLAARVLQITDVYDALTTVRPYKRALSPAEALDTMEDEVKKGWWDADVFTAFRELVARRREAAGPERAPVLEERER